MQEKNISTPLDKWIVKAKLLGIYDDYIIKYVDENLRCLTGSGDNITLERYSKLLGYKGKSESIELPPVDVIGKEAFRNKNTIKHIIVNENTKVIEENAFENCTRLESIKISHPMLELKPAIFVNCFNLQEVILPKILFKIGDSVFWNCTSLRELTIPSTVRFIDGYAFYSSGITKLIIPKNVKILGCELFYYCDKLEKLTILSKNFVISPNVIVNNRDIVDLLKEAVERDPNDRRKAKSQLVSKECYSIKEINIYREMYNRIINFIHSEYENRIRFLQ